MREQEWRDRIQRLVEAYVSRYRKEHGLPDIWRTPLVGYADAFDSYIQRLPEIVTEAHRLPQDFLDDPSVVISYFIPFTRELERTNVDREDRTASEEWADAS